MIFLTSSVAGVADHLFANYLEDKKYSTVLFIETAAEPELTGDEEDDMWFYDDLQSLKRQGCHVNRFSVTGKSREEIKHHIDEHDIIYMSGGNTAYLLQQLQNTDAVSLVCDSVRAGKTYIGTSAGSIIAGPKIPMYLEDDEQIKLDDYTGFRFTNIIPVPHWGADHFKDVYLEGRIQKAFTDDEPAFLLLNDHQYIVVADDGSLQVVFVGE